MAKLLDPCLYLSAMGISPSPGEERHGIRGGTSLGSPSESNFRQRSGCSKDEMLARLEHGEGIKRISLAPESLRQLAPHVERERELQVPRTTEGLARRAM